MYTPAPDLVLHFAAGTLAAATGVLASALAHQLGHPAIPVRWGAVVCAAAALAREAYNRQQGGRFSRRDIAATLAGGAPVLAVAWAVAA